MIGILPMIEMLLVGHSSQEVHGAFKLRPWNKCSRILLLSLPLTLELSTKTLVLHDLHQQNSQIKTPSPAETRLSFLAVTTS